MKKADTPLAKAARRYFFDPAPFLKAFRRDPRAAILTLRDSPASFGPVRTYLGKSTTAAAHVNLLVAARKAWLSIDPAAEVRATWCPRKDGKPKWSRAPKCPR